MSEANPEVDLDINNVNSTPGGGLAKLFRIFIHKAKLVPAVPYLLERYRRKKHGKGAEVVKTITKAVLEKNVYSKDMTVKVLIFLLTKIFDASKIEFSIKVTFPGSLEPVIATITINDDSDDVDVDLTTNINDDGEDTDNTTKKES